MQRIPEPELMDDEQQARDYASADFSEPHERFVQLFREKFPAAELKDSAVLDLGCGPGDITLRFARAYPGSRVDGVDGSPEMLKLAEKALGEDPSLAGRIRYFRGVLPAAGLPGERYDVVISNSLLHHLAEPLVLWNAVKRYGRAGTLVYIMDLLRPASEQCARLLVERYSGNESKVLKRDFYNSFLAAFEASEIREQLVMSGLDHLTVSQVSDRHVIVSGCL